MKLLAIDGNSIVNRAFYGIKALATKDGRYTNAIYGFMSILLKLKSEIEPDAVAIAFDVKQPTFRHLMYDGYKSNRKGMPDELASQMQPLKDLLTFLGYKIIEAPGWEADDILGTLADASGENDFCYIATGDRDSLQLVRENVNVLLASTYMGNATTVKYDVAEVEKKYLVSDPKLLIDIKALQGDSSDCIPGVAGIGEKTAKELVSKYGTIDSIYSNLDNLEIKKGVHDKLAADKDMAYLSRKLGTISTEAPVSKDYNDYIPNDVDVFNVSKLLSELEMFKLLDRLSLKPVEIKKEIENNIKVYTDEYELNDLKLFYNGLKKSEKVFFTFDNGVFYFATDNGVAVVNPENEGYVEFITDFLFDKDIKKYTYDCKSLYRFFYDYRLDIEVNNITGDAMLFAYIINPSATYELKRLVEEYAHIIVDDKASLSFLTAYLPAVFNELIKKINENGQQKLIDEIEMPLAKVLASMEKEGFFIDKVGIENFGVEINSKAQNLIREIYDEVGYEFNLNSPKQLGEALFEKMGLPAKKKTKTGYSTNAEVLEGLAEKYPVVAKILEYRTLSKLKSTYCDGLVKVIDKDGRVHSSLNQTETRTGRISSSEPNLQNIPVRSELGKEMRKFFVAKPGYVLIDADYSQIELRVLASCANDKNMIEAFNNGDDIHTITASQVFDLPPMMVTPVMRSRAKAVNFGIVYGIGAFSLSKNIGVSVKEADKYIKDYLNNFNGVRDYMVKTVEDAKKNCFVVSQFGRRRYLPEILSSNGLIRASAERMAMNMPIQGTAADIIKIAMVKVFNKLEEQKFNAKLILQVHDELIIEAPEEEKEKVALILKNEMENAVKMKVVMQADVGTGKTWYEAKN